MDAPRSGWKGQRERTVSVFGADPAGLACTIVLKRASCRVMLVIAHPT
jgi:hypothetical protein